jgi:DNA-binding transcriptional LysR family regulator
MTMLANHLEKLHAFAEVARLGSMRKAATSLRITQPALSRSVRVLEASLGHSLLRRTAKGVRPTPEGLVLKEACEQLRGFIHDVEARLQRLSLAVAGKIRIGTYESIAIYYWPKVFGVLARRYPGLQIQFQTATSDAVVRMLLRGDLDLAVAVEPRSHPRIEAIELYRDSFDAYVGTQRDAGGSPPVLFSPHAFEKLGIDPAATFRRLGLDKLPTYETSSFEVVSALTRNGVGIGILPGRVAAADLVAGSIRRHHADGGKRTAFGEHRVCIARPAGSGDEPAIAAITQACLAAVG